MVDLNRNNRVCTKRTWTQGRLGVRGGDQLWQGVKWDPSHHSSTIKCRPGVRLVSRAASRLTWATNKANDPSSPTILTWPTLVPPVVWERGPCEPSVFVLWLVDSACWSGGTFFSSLERCLVSGSREELLCSQETKLRDDNGIKGQHLYAIIFVFWKRLVIFVYLAAACLQHLCIVVSLQVQSWRNNIRSRLFFFHCNCKNFGEGWWRSSLLQDWRKFNH